MIRVSDAEQTCEISGLLNDITVTITCTHESDCTDLQWKRNIDLIYIRILQFTTTKTGQDRLGRADQRIGTCTDPSDRTGNNCQNVHRSCTLHGEDVCGRVRIPRITISEGSFGSYGLYIIQIMRIHLRISSIDIPNTTMNVM